MPTIRAAAVCRAPAIEVWRLVHDPARIHEWMEGTERAEPSGAHGVVTRYLAGWPEYPMPTRITARGEGCVTVSCLVSDIDIDIVLTPAGAGCRVDIEARIPPAEAAREDAMRGVVEASLARLAALTAAADDLG